MTFRIKKTFSPKNIFVIPVSNYIFKITAGGSPITKPLLFGRKDLVVCKFFVFKRLLSVKLMSRFYGLQFRINFAFTRQLSEIGRIIAQLPCNETEPIFLFLNVIISVKQLDVSYFKYCMEFSVRTAFTCLFGILSIHM